MSDDALGRVQSPVRCAYCGGIYDLGYVLVVNRYTDCSVWRAPCCGREVDDRGGDYTRVKRDDLAAMLRGESIVTRHGDLVAPGRFYGPPFVEAHDDS